VGTAAEAAGAGWRHFGGAATEGAGAGWQQLGGPAVEDSDVLGADPS
jgi:hypothetical protein